MQKRLAVKQMVSSEMAEKKIKSDVAKVISKYFQCDGDIGYDASCELCCEAKRSFSALRRIKNYNWGGSYGLSDPAAS